jgi:predicted histone-like DNA-binding protein
MGTDGGTPRLYNGCLKAFMNKNKVIKCPLFINPLQLGTIFRQFVTAVLKALYYVCSRIFSHIMIITMAIFFNKVQRALPASRTVKKWYASLKRISLIREKQVAKLIADETTLNHKEAEMAMSQLEKILLRELLASNSVQLGDWRSFHLTCSSSAHDTREEVTGRSIRKLNVRFTPGATIREGLEHAEFIPAESIVRELRIEN